MFKIFKGKSHIIKWLREINGSWEGEFKSEIFKDDEGGRRLSVYAENSSAKKYAEKCVTEFNSLPENIISDICKGIIKSAKENAGENFELPEISDPADILQYCWFTALYVSVPEDENQISYIVEGEGDWGEVIGFVIKNGLPVYVGADYFENAD
ncbi:MAG: hypothetical protein IJR59_05430 [Firmicutes bacterium]|nr:hypothetical protein [Bacillota bacterium]